MLFNGSIKNYQDLEVYQKTLAASFEIGKDIVPLLPSREGEDLAEQLRFSSQEIPRLIAEVYFKRENGFAPYLDEALTQVNEMIVWLSAVKEAYSKYVDSAKAQRLMRIYGRCAKAIYRLGKKLTRTQLSNTVFSKPFVR